MQKQEPTSPNHLKALFLGLVIYVRFAVVVYMVVSAPHISNHISDTGHQGGDQNGRRYSHLSSSRARCTVEGKDLNLQISILS